MTGAANADREILITREIQAPRDAVFRAFTTRNHMVQWIAPEGWTVTTIGYDFTVGGGWVFIARNPEGVNYSSDLRWLKIISPERLVLDEGPRAGAPKLFEAELTFTARGNATEVTLRATFNTPASRDLAVRRFNAIDGWTHSLGTLETYAAALSKSET